MQAHGAAIALIESKRKNTEEALTKGTITERYAAAQLKTLSELSAYIATIDAARRAAAEDGGNEYKAGFIAGLDRARAEHDGRPLVATGNKEYIRYQSKTKAMQSQPHLY